jgi:Lsr2
MAEQIIKRLIDDIDGAQAAGTARFSIDGADYEIDLSQTNMRKLHEIMSPYVSAARKVLIERRRVMNREAGARRRNAERGRVAEVRAWALARGIQISDRGRIPRDIQEQYDRAQDAKARHESDMETARQVLEGNPSPTQAALAHRVLDSPSARHSAGRRRRNDG